MLDGICRSYLLNPEGEEINISLYTSKSILSPFTTRTKDEISVINFQALTDVNIVSINAFEFEKLMEKNLEIRNFGNIVLRNELAIKVDKEIGLASLTAKERFIKFSEQFPLLENLKMLLLMVFIICLTSCNNQNNKFATTKDNVIENLDSLIRNDRKSFLTKLMAGIESDEENADLIVNWLAVNFDWKATDYKKRSVQQIIDRGGGNCNDLAKVTINLMDGANIKIRKVKEINIQAKSNERQKSAAILVNEKGFKYSVFGMMHNDHVW